jgi:uncharacterized protein YecT (DUF1311 family)
VREQRIQEHTDAYDLDFAYPQIDVSNDDTMVQDLARSLLTGFKEAVAFRTAGEPRYFAQLTYEITRNDDRAVVMVLDYALYTGGAHPNSRRTTFNFLMPDGVRVFLPDLIGSLGIQRVSSLAIAELTAELSTRGSADPGWIGLGAGPYADNFEAFEWLPSELVVHFDPYEVASYADGPQEVRIPRSAVQDFVRAEPRAPLPSFDCSDAASAVEQAICSDQALAQLDRRVAEAYAARLRLEAIGMRPPSVRAQQIAWLGQRDAACAGLVDAAAILDCLKAEYASRLTTLRGFD